MPKLPLVSLAICTLTICSHSWLNVTLVPLRLGLLLLGLAKLGTWPEPDPETAATGMESAEGLRVQRLTASALRPSP